MWPILLYGSEVWGAYEYDSNQENFHKWDKSPREAVHAHFLKRLLGVNQSTTNVMIRTLKNKAPPSYPTWFIYMKQISDTKSDLQRPSIHKSLSIKQEISENAPQFDNCDVSHATVPNENFNIFNRSKTFLSKCLKQGYHKIWKSMLNQTNKFLCYRKHKWNIELESYLL